MDRYLLQTRTGREIPPKTVYLVRHGESTQNARSLSILGADINDARYVDAPLTKWGQCQAAHLANKVARIDPQLIVTSPMTRATQTCLYACQSIPSVPIVVNKHCAERVAYSGDIGTPVSELRNRFPDLDYASIRPDCWWWRKPGTSPGVANSLAEMRRHHPGSYEGVEPKEHMYRRVDKFREWLLLRPESRIIVFAHGVFLTSFAGDNIHFANTEVRKVVL